MSTATQSITAFVPASQPIPTAAFEVLGYLGISGVGTLCFLLGWLQANGAAVLVAVLLASLAVLSWKHFNQGRHPCFLFLSILLLLQGGRLVTYCLGSEPDPLRIRVQTYYPFDVSRDQAGIVLLCLALSAICIYAPCRWNYRRVAPPGDGGVRRYLPYLYLLFYSTLPIQLFKNYKYYEYVQQHGGYVSFFINHGDIAGSVPFFVRAIVLISFPAFVAIFVFERRKKYLYLATILYFATASLVLLLGLRGGVFTLALTLWYIAGVKSTKRSRILVLGVLAAMLVLVGAVVQSFREDELSLSDFAFAPIEFVTLQGNSLDVTEVAVKYRPLFAPYAASYLWNELKNAFVASDTSNYFRGKSLAFDVPVFLNSNAFALGHGTGGSYVAEAYVIGGLAGVALISLLIGIGLHLLHRLSQNALSLFVVAMILPDVFTMPRGNLLDWLSVFFRNGISILLLVLGWKLYELFITARPVSALSGRPGKDKAKAGFSR
jgi:oligosaccharide repeat unit polymerase